jgi:hypothetical protein
MSRTAIHIQRQQLAARLGYAVVGQAPGDPAAGRPPTWQTLSDWLVPLANDACASLRFMMALAEPLLSEWRSWSYVRDDDTLERVLSRVRVSLEGAPITASESEALVEQMDALHPPISGVFIRDALPLDDVIEVFKVLLYWAEPREGDAAGRRDGLAIVAATAQAVIVGAPDFTRGPFADASREVARWLLDEG